MPVSEPLRFPYRNELRLPVIGLEDEYPPGYTDLSHSHARAQLLYASSGVMSVIVDTASFVIPPQRAVWVPAGHAHEVSCRGHVSLRTLYFDNSVHDLGDGSCRVIEVSDFLHALILEVAHFGSTYDMSGREGRIIRLLIGLAVWRQQVRLMEALSLLASGRAITTVAFDVGYESPSAFTALFHRAFGVPPSQYRVR